MILLVATITIANIATTATSGPSCTLPIVIIVYLIRQHSTLPYDPMHRPLMHSKLMRNQIAIFQFVFFCLFFFFWLKVSFWALCATYVPLQIHAIKYAAFFLLCCRLCYKQDNWLKPNYKRHLLKWCNDWPVNSITGYLKPAQGFKLHYN